MSFSCINTFQSTPKNKIDTIDPSLLFWYKLKNGDINVNNELFNYANGSYDASYNSNEPPVFSTATKKIYGSSIFLNISTNSTIKLPSVNLTINDAYTISFWACQTNPDNTGTYILTSYGDSPNYSNTLTLASCNGNYIYNKGFFQDSSNIGYTSDGLWHHFTIIFGKSTYLALYIDNVLSSVINGTNTTPFISINSKFNFIGSNPWAGQFINTYISDYRLYNRQLSTNEITSLYNNIKLQPVNITARPIFSYKFDKTYILGETITNNDYTFTLRSIPKGYTLPYKEYTDAYGITLMGINVEIADIGFCTSDLDLPISYTIILWTAQWSSGVGVMIGVNILNHSNWHRFNFSNSSYRASHKGLADVIDKTLRPNGAWCQVAVSYNNLTKICSLYHNGILVASGTGNNEWIGGIGAGLCIGCEALSNGCRVGYINTVKIYDNSLSPADILGLYNDDKPII